MNILLSKDDKGGTAVLTTDAPGSHYGIPILRIEAEDVSGDFGPGDIVHEQAMPGEHGAEWGQVLLGFHIVRGWLAQPRTEQEREAGLAFLRQSPYDLSPIRDLGTWGMYRATGTFPGAQPLNL